MLCGRFAGHPVLGGRDERVEGQGLSGLIVLLAVAWLAYCVAGYVVALVSLVIVDREDKSRPWWLDVWDAPLSELFATLAKALPLSLAWPAIAIQWMKD